VVSLTDRRLEIFEVKVIFRPTIVWPLSPGVRPPCGTRYLFSWSLILWDALSDERMGF
jgi:hypothetical protein